MSTILVIEAPYKTQAAQEAINWYKNIKVVATSGHLFNFPKHGTGFDKDNMPIFRPVNKNRVKKLQEQLNKADEVIIATDPDREGELIAFHVYTLIEDKKKVRRIRPRALTEEEFRKQLENAVEINFDVVRAALTRHCIDRIIGYSYSALAKKDLRKPIAIGRVKTAVLRFLHRKKLTSYYEGKMILALGYTGAIVAKTGFSHTGNRPLSRFHGWSRINNINRIGMVTKSRPLTTNQLMCHFASSGGIYEALSAYNTAQQLYQKGIISYIRVKEPVYTEDTIQFGSLFTDPREIQLVPQMPISGHEGIHPVKKVDSATLSGEEQKVYDYITSHFVTAIKDKKHFWINADVEYDQEQFQADILTDHKDFYNYIFPNNLGYTKLDAKHFDHRVVETLQWMDRSHVATPSTYASTLTSLLEKRYIDDDFLLTPLGKEIVDWVAVKVPWLDGSTSRNLEEILQQIEQSKLSFREAFQLLIEYDRRKENREKYEELIKEDIVRRSEQLFVPMLTM